MPTRDNNHGCKRQLNEEGWLKGSENLGKLRNNFSTGNSLHNKIKIFNDSSN